MSFTSLSYFVFLVSVLILFNVTGARYRSFILLLASYIFYGFLLKPVLLLVLTTVIICTYCFGGLIYKSQQPRSRKLLLWTGILADLVLLFQFKYVPFLVENVNHIFRLLSVDLSFSVPAPLASVGVSFFVFQSISYLTDIYFKELQHESALCSVALYISFFPKLLQGPIERGTDLLGQLKEPQRSRHDNLRDGFLLFSWGLFKKVVVADRLALFVDPVYGNVHAYGGGNAPGRHLSVRLPDLLRFFRVHRHGLGDGSTLNIRLTPNFNAPYLATSMADFWRRWHISLSRWILDYIFVPLQHRWREWETGGTAVALLVTFIASGFWHGASWGYLAWGALHGLFFASSVLWKPYQKKLYKAACIRKNRYLKAWQTAITFHLVCFTYIFFRADSLGDALHVAREVIAGVPRQLRDCTLVQLPQLLCPQQPQENLLFLMAVLLLMTGLALGQRYGNGAETTEALTFCPELRCR